MALDQRQYRKAVQLLREFVLAVAIAVVLVVFFYQPVKVEGRSMMPSLVDQERIFINKFAYRFTPVARGDVIVFRCPTDTSRSYIKRVIAMPGDRVAIVDGVVRVNGVPLDEPYVPTAFRDRRSMDEMRVPDEEYFVLGDHRNRSSDSRDFGVVDRHAIDGKAVFIYWPPEKLGQLR